MDAADSNLLAQLLSGDLTPEEAERLDVLLDRSPEARHVVVCLFGGKPRWLRRTPAAGRSRVDRKPVRPA
jgi:hypothetical protein